MKEIKKRRPKENKKHLSAFAKAAIIYAISLAALFAALIGVLSAFLYTYEKNLPEKVAEGFAAGLGREELSALVKAAAGEIGEFETAELLIDRTEHLSGRIRQAKLAKEYTSEAPVYRLICGDSDIGKLTLKRAEKNAAFGIARFEVDEVILYKESVPGALERTSVEVCVPHGAVLRVNGKAAGESNGSLWEQGVPYTGSTVTAENTLCDIYFIDGLCLVPELEAEFEGSESVMGVLGGRADWFGEKERTFTLTVPSDAYVSINGKTPSPSLASHGELTDAVNEFEKHLGDALPKTLSYTVCGSREDTEISVSVNGKALEGEWFDEGKKVIYLYSDESRFSVSATLPSEAVLYINGVAVSDSYSAGEKAYEGLSGIQYLSSDSLLGKHYEISGFLCEPSITAMMGDTELPLCSLSRNEQNFKAEFYGKNDDDVAVKNAADNFTRTYFHYVANGAVGIEENYSALVGLMKNGSPGYRQIQRSKSSFEFVNQGVYRIDLISPKNIISLGAGLTYCRVDYSVNLRFYRNEKLYEGTLSLVFIKENDTYLVCDMVIDSEG